MVTDRFGRTFKSLRVSLTGLCNLACTYCVPEKKCHKEPEVSLSIDELLKVIGWLKEILGLTKIRLTGGEPLISPIFNKMLENVSKLGFEDLSLTTNGQILKKKIPFLVDYGVKRINVSLDNLVEKKFNQNTRGGSLNKTLEGINEALRHKIQIKLNVVPMKGVNEEEILDLLDFALEKGIELRYIELMQMGHLSDRETYEKHLIPIAEIFEIIASKYQFEKASASLDSTSSRYLIKDKGTFGVIANESAPFCAHCNRLRLTSTGFIHGCLSSNERFSVRPLLNLDEIVAKKELVKILNQALHTKREISFDGSQTLMRQVGG